MKNILFVFLLLSTFSWADLNSEVFYYVLVDRFKDGNRENNIPDWAFPTSQEIKNKEPNFYQYNLTQNYWLKKMVFPIETQLPRNQFDFLRYWGGDLEGVMEKLDYLAQDLGVTSLVLSGVFDNPNGMSYDLQAPGTSYRGKWTNDWYLLEEHFVPEVTVSPEATLDSLLEARVLSEKVFLEKFLKKAHRLGLKVLLEFPLNHTSPVDLNLTLGSQNKTQIFLGLGSIFLQGDLLLHYCYPSATVSCRSRIDSSGWFNPPCDKKGFISSRDRKKCRKSLCPDLNQEDVRVQNYLLKAMEKWSDLGIDGYYFNDLGSIEESFVQKLDRFQPSSGKALMIATLDGDTDEALFLKEDKKRYQNQYLNLHFLKDEWISSVRDFFGSRQNPQKNKKQIEKIINEINQDDLLSFDNSEIIRLLNLPGVDFRDYRAAILFLLMSPGNPFLFYGDEFGLSLEKHIDGEGLLAKSSLKELSHLMMSWPEEENEIPSPLRRITEEKKELFKEIQLLLKLRKEKSALFQGQAAFLKALPVKDGSFLLNFANRLVFPKDEESLSMKRWMAQGSSLHEIYYFYHRPKGSYRYETMLSNGDYIDLLNPERKVFVRNGELLLTLDQDKEVVILEKRH